MRDCSETMERPVISTARCDHVVQFYEDDASVCESGARYLREGLEGGEGALVVAGEKHRRGIAAALDASGLDVEGARSRGELTELDAQETLSLFLHGDLRRGYPDEGDFRRIMGRIVDRLGDGRGRSGLRIYGQMADLLAGNGNELATARLEELWIDLSRTHRFKRYCGYSLTSFHRAEDGEFFRRICSLHTRVVPTETYDPSLERDEQHRRIAFLQQRAGALEVEVAARQKLEEALRSEQERLREANRRKDEFIGLLSHELRNPIAPILTSLDVMDVRGDPGSRREREIIRRQARHLAALVEDLLDVSRVASGKISLQKQPMECAAVASIALEMACPLIQERHHTLEIAIPKTGLLVEADPVRLPQVFANLLRNAAQYTPPGGRIVFTAERQGLDVVVCVADNGAGIDHDALGGLFAPFTQGRRNLDRSEGGLGLGLTLVRSLTQLHGGSAAAFSDGPGKGSRFVLRLPVLRNGAPRPQRNGVSRTQGNGVSRSEGNGNGTTHAPGNGSPAKSSSGAPTMTAPLSGAHGSRRVLVVDDNRDAAFALAELLSHLGFDVRTAHDGPTAIELTRIFEPRTAFVDIGLPEMDGYTLATRLRRLERGDSMCLVAVSGYGQATDRAKGILAGFDAHVVKPLSLDTLRALLHRATDLSKK
jgi:signal transduction histidine kinase/ActR/RegA family two-component response regulator